MLGMVEPSPYPHLIVDGALPGSELQALLDNWPAPEKFSQEIVGNTAAWLNSVPPPDAWREFLPLRASQLSQDVVVAFAPWIISRLGRDVGPLTVYSCVMEATPAFIGHRVHNHHYHSPNWLATVLIYLDDDAGDFEGTVINRHVSAGDIASSAELFTHTGMWSEIDGFSEAAVVPYGANRMFAFADGPTSFHSSHKPTGAALGRRRAFRMHIAASWDVCQRLYGVSEEEYGNLHPYMETATDPRVRAWAARDIEAMNSPVDISPEDARAWATGLEYVVAISG